MCWTTVAAGRCSAPVTQPHWPPRRPRCSLTRERRATLVERGSERAREYDWSRVAKQVIAVYETVTPSGEKVREDDRQGPGLFARRLPRGGRREPESGDARRQFTGWSSMTWTRLELVPDHRRLLAGGLGVLPARACLPVLIVCTCASTRPPPRWRHGSNGALPCPLRWRCREPLTRPARCFC